MSAKVLSPAVKLVSLVSAALLCYSCRPVVTSYLGPDEVPRELLILPNANEFKAFRQSDTSTFVQYTVKEGYPAPAAIEAFSTHLAELGWSSLPNDWLNPGTPSSHVRGWTSYYDSTRQPSGIVDQWLAQWQDAGGALVVLELQYFTATDSYVGTPHPDSDNLSVIAGLMPDALAKALTRNSHSTSRGNTSE